jgi:fructose-bisphosphate aldolase, class I
MKNYRLNRLFNAKSGRCFDVAVDHGFFNQPGFLQGIEDMRKVVRTLVDAGPDAIQLTLGQARHLQEIQGRQKASLVLRTDVANIYGRELPDSRFSLMIDDAMLQAVRYDAACVCVNLFQIPGAPEVHAQCVENILRLKPEADYYGMPMMVEPLVFQPNSKAGGYMVDGDVVKISHLVRQAVELGADIIKADPTDDVTVYHQIIEVASGIPVPRVSFSRGRRASFMAGMSSSIPTRKASPRPSWPWCMTAPAWMPPWPWSSLQGCPSRPGGYSGDR